MNHLQEYSYIVLHDFFTSEEVESMQQGGITREQIDAAQSRLEALLDTTLLYNYSDIVGIEGFKGTDNAACELTLSFAIKGSSSVTLDTLKGERKVVLDSETALLFNASTIPHIYKCEEEDIYGTIHWNDTNTEVGSFMKHFELDKRLEITDFNTFKMEGRLPIWHNHN